MRRSTTTCFFVLRLILCFCVSRLKLKQTKAVTDGRHIEYLALMSMSHHFGCGNTRTHSLTLTFIHSHEYDIRVWFEQRKSKLVCDNCTNLSLQCHLLWSVRISALDFPFEMKTENNNKLNRMKMCEK